MPPRIWQVLFAWSPLLSIIGAAAGGVFLIRAILVTSNDEYTFGPDIPIAGAVLLLWGAGVWALLSPPSSTLAQEVDGASPSGVIWSLGRRFRAWNVGAAPVAGLLLGMLSAPSLDLLAEIVSGAPSESVHDPALLALGGCVLPVALITARFPLWGAELRSELLIVRGVLWTRRYRKSEIVSVHSHEVTGLSDYVLGVLFNSHRSVFYVMRMQLTTGRTKTLYASTSSKPDIDRAARIVTTWMAGAGAAVATAAARS
ncbi:hypothetical protein DBR36_01995 [Microbacterium sp. HMWF026]|uniref:hypothetical protein n=1 Tax=Microbacterium sp. HMWF026 TaxID=2056861 RepID=UPI000D3D7305|nr:hypothetical protein [Microbacterium sp. HMWF026]PTT22427.1 hypothetical protein DBR36_01995 [Microbacterium sp. HMWF026]